MNWLAFVLLGLLWPPPQQSIVKESFNPELQRTFLTVETTGKDRHEQDRRLRVRASYAGKQLSGAATVVIELELRQRVRRSDTFRSTLRIAPANGEAIERSVLAAHSELDAETYALGCEITAAELQRLAAASAAVITLDGIVCQLNPIALGYLKQLSARLSAVP